MSYNITCRNVSPWILTDLAPDRNIKPKKHFFSIAVTLLCPSLSQNSASAGPHSLLDQIQPARTPTAMYLYAWWHSEQFYSSDYAGEKKKNQESEHCLRSKSTACPGHFPLCFTIPIQKPTCTPKKFTEVSQLQL